MCWEWCCSFALCCGSTKPKEGEDALPPASDVPWTNKMCVALAALLGWGISVPICYFHHTELKKLKA